MTDSTFDPSTFLDATTTEALVKRPPIPQGSELVGVITDAVARSWQSNKPEAKVKSGIAVDLKIQFDLTQYPEIHRLVNADQVTLTPGIMLDMKDDGRSIDWGTGKNGTLRRYREALDMNKPGEAFSIRQMIGRPIRVRTKLREYQGDFYDEVDSVSRA
jgi:hypothetical protein